MAEPYWTSRDGRHRIYLGDCREILPDLSGIDCVVTDPPYGVMLGNDGPSSLGKEQYEGFIDCPEFVRDIYAPVISLCVSRFYRVVVTPGIRNCWDYQKPDELGCIYNPAGAGFSRWGFTCSQPILFYGKDPKSKKMPQSVYSIETSDRNGHPCAKPVRLMLWLVDRASNTDECVLDPFMGSGTTGVACVRTGRRFIGIEISQQYCDIAVERMECELAQGRLFEPQPEPTQASIF